jgi:hypothetical protein
MSLKLIIRRLSWAAKNNKEVLDNTGLRECSETLLLSKLVRVHVLSSCFASCHKEDVVSHESSRVEEGHKAKENEGKRYSEMIDSFAE